MLISTRTVQSLFVNSSRTERAIIAQADVTGVYERAAVFSNSSVRFRAGANFCKYRGVLRLRLLKRINFCAIAFLLFAFEVIFPAAVAAYVDPGTTGMVSQLLYVLFYVALGGFLYFVRYIKQYVANAKHLLAKFFGRG